MQEARYFRAIDLHDWDDLDSLYTPDAGFDGFAFPTGTPRQFIDGVSAYLADIRSAHQGYNADLHLLPDGRVRGIWAMHEVLFWETGSRDSYRDIEIAGQWGIDGYGYCEDEYTLTDEGWRISFHRLTSTVVRALVGEAPVLIPARVMRAPTAGWLETGGD